MATPLTVVVRRRKN